MLLSFWVPVFLELQLGSLAPVTTIINVSLKCMQCCIWHLLSENISSSKRDENMAYMPMCTHMVWWTCVFIEWRFTFCSMIHKANYPWLLYTLIMPHNVQCICIMQVTTYSLLKNTVWTPSLIFQFSPMNTNLCRIPINVLTQYNIVCYQSSVHH